MPSYTSDKYAGTATIRITYHHALGDLHTDVLVVKSGALTLAEVTSPDLGSEGIKAVQGKTIDLTKYALVAHYSDGTANSSISDWTYSDNNGPISNPAAYTVPANGTSITVSSTNAGGSQTFPLTVTPSNEAVTAPPTFTGSGIPSIIPAATYTVPLSTPTDSPLVSSTVVLKDAFNNEYTIPNVSTEDSSVSFVSPKLADTGLAGGSTYSLVVTPTYQANGDTPGTTTQSNPVTISNVPYNTSTIDESFGSKPIITGVTDTGSILGTNFNSETVVFTKDTNGFYNVKETAILNGTELLSTPTTESGTKAYPSNPVESATEPYANFVDDGDGTYSMDVHQSGNTTNYALDSLPRNADLTKQYPLELNRPAVLPQASTVQAETPSPEIDGNIDSNSNLNIVPNHLINVADKFGVILNLKRDVLTDLVTDQVDARTIPLTRQTGKFVFQTKGKDNSQNVIKSRPIPFLTAPQKIQGIEVMSQDLGQTSLTIRWGNFGQSLKYLNDAKVYKKAFGADDSTYALATTSQALDMVAAGKHRAVSVTGLTANTAYTFKLVLSNDTGSAEATIDATTKP